MATRRSVASSLVGAIAVAAAVALASCAPATLSAGRNAERLKDYDQAIVEYTKAVRAHPESKEARAGLERVRLLASQEHFTRGRRLAANGRTDQALLELQIASELNPTDSGIDAELRSVRNQLRARVAVDRQGKTELQTLVERARNLPPPGLDLPDDVKLPASLIFSQASSRVIFTAIAKFAGLNVVFDPAFRDADLSIDLRNSSLEDALTSVAASTRNFYRVTASRTITVIPDTPAKRREYEEEVVRTFYLSNADLKEAIDLLRIVVDARKIAPINATNALTIKDTPERIAAAGRVLAAIDKARPEVVIDVELLEVDRTKLKEYGLQIASPGSPGISGSADPNREGLTLNDLRNLTSADILVTGVPALYYRLLKNDTNTRILASPRLRTAEGIAATARFGERVPVPVTTFAPIATGGISQQPITSYVYENVGVGIDIQPRTHHDDEVTLAVKVDVSSISGTGYAGLPTFGNRAISTTIRLHDGETNMLAGLIRDDERTVLSGVPGLTDIPVIGRLFAYNHRETQETDIILTLTPHIIRVLDLEESDLRPFKVGRDLGLPVIELPAGMNPPEEQPAPAQPKPVGPIVQDPTKPQPIRPPEPPKKPIPIPVP
ncbi:MAG: secretin N-terminal domain-containing protein [Acidobacteriota bacterium]